ncbi:MAG: DNA repair protein RecO [Candidatus Gastranaerophilales bacterium]|nr:DNA repair protein RecO [Candidatus Gastranaerophilales bacterium]
MSKNYTTDAININSYNLSESDKIIVMYSKEHGIIRAVAKGVKKPKSKLSGRMDMLIANNLVLVKGRNLDIVSQAEVLHNFKNLRIDINKLSFSMYCAELVSVFGIENDFNSEIIYNLLVDTLEKINSTAGKSNILAHVLDFQMQLMDIVGYKIALNNCACCFKPYDKNFGFSMQGGGVICPSCGQNHAFSAEVIEVFKNPFDCQNLALLEKSFNILKDFISFHSQRKIKSLNFLECI